MSKFTKNEMVTLEIKTKFCIIAPMYRTQRFFNWHLNKLNL